MTELQTVPMPDLAPLERIIAELKPTAIESTREREVTEMVEFIASFCAEPSELHIVRRAARNLYNVGRTHEAIDSVNRMMETTRMIAEGARA